MLRDDATASDQIGELHHRIGLIEPGFHFDGHFGERLGRLHRDDARTGFDLDLLNLTAAGVAVRAGHADFVDAGGEAAEIPLAIVGSDDGDDRVGAAVGGDANDRRHGPRDLAAVDIGRRGRRFRRRHTQMNSCDGIQMKVGLALVAADESQGLGGIGSVGAGVPGDGVDQVERRIVGGTIIVDWRSGGGGIGADREVDLIAAAGGVPRFGLNADAVVTGSQSGEFIMAAVVCLGVRDDTSGCGNLPGKPGGDKFSGDPGVADGLAGLVQDDACDHGLARHAEGE